MTNIKTVRGAKKWFATQKKPVRCVCRNAALVCKTFEEAEAFFEQLLGPPSKDNVIQTFFHCDTCIRIKPPHVSPREWAQLEVGWTSHGFQVWCKRCELNVIHVDLLGQKVKAV
jgi:hypothetical protein